jgi:hypothetical protein
MLTGRCVFPCSILGKNPDSKDTRNLVSAVTANVAKGSRRISVSS